MTTEHEVRDGLAGVPAARTSVSRIEADPGRLFYCGYAVEELAARATFEETCFLLWNERLPDAQELDELRAELASYRDVPRPVIRLLASFPRDTPAMTALRTAISALGAFDPDAEDATPEAGLRKAKRLVAQTAVLVGAWHRVRQGKDVIKPDPKLGHVADFLRQIHGRKTRTEHERLLEAALICLAEHGLNPSTFAARVTASTLTDVHSAITAAVGALKGPLHGGASQQAMELLLKIEDPEAVDAHLRPLFEAGEKIPGFGHRAYASEDPRATVLASLAEPFARRAGEGRLVQLTRRVVEVVGREKSLTANVELWSAPVFHLVRLPPDLFPAVFAAGRMAGWTAHVLEQRADNRLFRPTAAYDGEAPRPWVPLEKR